MELTYMENGYYQLNSENRTVLLTYGECKCIVDYFRRLGWRGMLNAAIDNDEDHYDFSKISREEFLDMCIEEIQWKYDAGTLHEPEYDDIVFDMAEGNGVWKE